LNSFTFTPIDPAAYRVIAVNNDVNSSPTVEIKDNLNNITPIVAAGPVYTITGNATVSQINSTLELLPGIVGRQYRILNFQWQAIGGAFSGCTTVQIGDGTQVSFAVPVATLTQNTIVTPSSANVTFTQYAWAGKMGAGLHITLGKTGGSSCATATSLNYSISYTVNN
jgi:hypothetical protein